MKKTLIILLFLSIGCSDNDNLKSATKDGKQIFIFQLQEICYDGVVYLFSKRNNFSSVKFNKDGKIETCQ